MRRSLKEERDKFMSDSRDKLLTTYPAIDIAFRVSMDTYEWMAKRFDALDAKIQTVMAVAVTSTFAIPLAFGALKLSPSTSWAYSGLMFFGLSVWISIHARLRGSMRMISPAVFYEGWLSMSESEFKKNAIFFAGEHFNRNANVMDEKYRFFLWSILCLGLESVCWVLSVL